MSSYVVPDLRQMAPERYAALASIVLEGALAERGMPGFADQLTPAELEQLRAYMLSEARGAYDAQQTASKGNST